MCARVCMRVCAHACGVSSCASVWCWHRDRVVPSDFRVSTQGGGHQLVHVNACGCLWVYTCMCVCVRARACACVLVAYVCVRASLYQLDVQDPPYRHCP